MLLPKTVKWMLALDPHRKFYCRCLMWMTAGQIVEIHRLGRDRKLKGSRTTEAVGGR
jgi:hypothetical protein